MTAEKLAASSSGHSYLLQQRGVGGGVAEKVVELDRDGEERAEETETKRVRQSEGSVRQSSAEEKVLHRSNTFCLCWR